MGGRGSPPTSPFAFGDDLITIITALRQGSWYHDESTVTYFTGKTNHFF